MIALEFSTEPRERERLRVQLDGLGYIIEEHTPQFSSLDAALFLYFLYFLYKRQQAPNRTGKT